MTLSAKNSSGSRPILITSFVLDFVFVLIGILWLSGGVFCLPESWQETFRMKPGIHRLLMGVLGIAAGALGIFMMQRKKETPLIHFLRSLSLPHKSFVQILFLFLGTLWGASSAIRHSVFHSSFDMAIFTQAIWNTTHGNFLYSSIKGGICLLGDHFSPLLAVLAVPYHFWPNPVLILYVQAFAAASCVFPLDQFARMELRKNSNSLLILTAFAFYIPVRNAVRFDFHPEILIMPVLIYAHLRLVQDRLKEASGLLFIALLAKENAALVTFASGFYAALFLKRKAFGIFWMVFSAAYFFAVIKWVIPVFAPQGYFYLDANFLQWKRFGLSALVQHLLQPSSAAYLIKIFAPVGFLSFLDLPSFFLTLPMLAQNLIARNEAARSIFFQYTALLTPYVFISAVYGARKIINKNFGFYYVLFWIIGMAGVSEFYVIREHQIKDSARLNDLRSYFHTIPEDLSVRTHEFFAPHLANRKYLHIYENDNPAEGGRPEALNSDLVIIDRRLLGNRSDEIIQDLVARSYKLTKEMKGVVVLKRSGQKL